MALWDLLGKHLNAPVWRLLGGRKSQRMAAYASGGWADAQHIGEQLLGYVARGGFKAVKMRVGVIDGDPINSARRVKAARAALGPDMGLACDAHGTYTVAEAKRFCRLVEDCNLLWFEEPVTADDKRGMAEVRAATAIPIAAGESEFNRFDFRDLAELRAADIFQPDLAICGGISEAMRIGAIAAAWNLKLAPHLWTGALAFAAGMHVAAASPAGPAAAAPPSSLSSHPACLISAGVSTPFQSGSCPWQNRQLVSSGVPAECSCQRARQAACTGRGQAHGSTSLSSAQQSVPHPPSPLRPPPSPLRVPSPRQTQQASPEVEVFLASRKAAAEVGGGAQAQSPHAWGERVFWFRGFEGVFFE